MTKDTINIDTALYVKQIVEAVVSIDTKAKNQQEQIEIFSIKILAVVNQISIDMFQAITTKLNEAPK